MARSLKVRALRWLAQREHSRSELRRKLLALARAQAEDGERDASEGSATLPATTPESIAAAVDAVLDDLEAQRYLSDERFVESRVNARAARFGDRRIREELRQHQVALSPEAAHALAQTELSRAQAVRTRKFAEWPLDAAQRARQARFLAARGFSAETIGRALRPARDRD